MKNKLIILVVLGIMAAGCSRKAVPAIPSVSNPCDKEIQALLDSVQNVEPTYIYDVLPGEIDTVSITDSSDCNYFKIAALEIAGKYNTAVKERDYYKALAQSHAKKIINNTFINSKNKNSQVGDGNQASKSGTNQSGTGNVNQDVKKGPAQNGNDNEAVFKPKKSATGEGSSVDNSKKGSIWPWILVGMMSWFIIQNFIWNAAKKYIPGFLPVSFLTKIIGKIKFLT